jgi:hypothetical protein
MAAADTAERAILLVKTDNATVLEVVHERSLMPKLIPKDFDLRVRELSRRAGALALPAEQCCCCCCSCGTPKDE